MACFGSAARWGLCCLVNHFRGVTKMITVQRGLNYPSISCATCCSPSRAHATCHGSDEISPAVSSATQSARVAVSAIPCWLAPYCAAA